MCVLLIEAVRLAPLDMMHPGTTRHSCHPVMHQPAYLLAAGFQSMLPSLLPHMHSPEELEKLKGIMVRSRLLADRTVLVVAQAFVNQCRYAAYDVTQGS